ncbi:MAG: phosphate-binding protein [Epulopiscium sp. Nele67-Bin005]|nr:MAG: phosphate-binding protein [Epulopiscium sp. Nele67-Bin005]
MKNRMVKLFSLLTVGSMVLVGCGSSDSGSGGGSGTTVISTVGSTTVATPMEVLADAYMAKNSSVVVEVQGVGSSSGIKAAYDGSADMGMASRTLKEEEKTWGLTETTIALDAIAVCVNPANSVTTLTFDQLKGIYEGDITNWSEVGGPNEQIIVVTREDGSGTRGAFEELVGLQEDRDGNTISTIAATALVQQGNGAVQSTVASREYAIGYMSLGNIDSTVKPLAVDGVEPTVAAALAGTYKISRPLLVLTSDSANDVTKDFLSFILSAEGQEIVGQSFIPVN